MIESIEQAPRVETSDLCLLALASESHKSASLSEIGDPWLKVLLRRPSFDELHNELRCKPKAGTLAEVREAYLPTNEIVTLVGQVFDALRHSLERKDFGDPTFRRYFHALSELFSGHQKVSLPAFPASLCGTGIRVTGVSGSGKTALLQRLRVMLGPPHFLEFQERLKGRLCFVPMLIVRYPDCGTVKGLVAGIREQLLAQLATIHTQPTALKEMFKGDMVGGAISACLTANVGLIAIDGACSEAVTPDIVDVMKAINRLKNYTGTPIIFTATPSFMHVAAHCGSVFANLFNGPALHLSVMAPPKPQKISTRDGEVGVFDVSTSGIWYQFCRWHFGLWKFKQSDMPTLLPDWIFPFALGRVGWLSQGFDALRAKLESMPQITASEITENMVKLAFYNQLDVHEEARHAINKSLGDKPTLDEVDFLRFSDHLDTSVFLTSKFRQYLSKGGKRSRESRR